MTTKARYTLVMLLPLLTFFATEDELQNVEMAEHERTKKNNEMRIKKADYTGYDDEEFKEGHVGMKRAVLAKYDEDMDGETVRACITAQCA